MELKKLLQYKLPKEVVENFEVIDINEEDSKVVIHLDEKNQIPKEYEEKQIESKGFSEPIRIIDYPLRDRPVILSIRKRKWRDKQTKETYSNKWELTAKGTSYSKEFGAFLKEMVR